MVDRAVVGIAALRKQLVVFVSSRLDKGVGIQEKTRRQGIPAGIDDKPQIKEVGVGLRLRGLYHSGMEGLAPITMK